MKARDVLEFVNVLEDDPDRMRLSQTKMIALGTTIAAFMTVIYGMDWQSQATSGGLAIGSWIKAEWKRRTEARADVLNLSTMTK